MSNEVRVLCTLNDKQVEEQAPEGEESETLNGEDKARKTPIRDVRHHVDLSTKVSHPDKTPSGDHETLTRDKEMNQTPN